jgi:hypothetical protein
MRMAAGPKKGYPPHSRLQTDVHQIRLNELVPALNRVYACQRAQWVGVGLPQPMGGNRLSST